MINNKLPNGTRDEFGPTAAIKETVEQQLCGLFKTRGFQKIITPVLEYSAVFMPLRNENYQQYQLLDEHGSTVVMRPDLTLPVARAMSTGLAVPAKWYYSGDVFKITKRFSGGYNQTTQAGVEIIGYSGIKAELESVAVALNGCQRLGIADLQIQLGDAGFVDAVLEELPLSLPTKQTLKQALFDKRLADYEQIWRGIDTPAYLPFLKRWPWLFGDFEQVMATVAQLPGSKRLTAISERLRAVAAFIQQRFPEFKVTLDLSRPAPQDYYTGLCFSGFTTDTAEYLFSGGRYDQLLSQFQANAVPAIGVAFNVDAIATLQCPATAPVATLVYGRIDQWDQVQAVVDATPQATICLADSRQAAQQIAEQQHCQLIDLTREDDDNATN